MNTVYNDIPPVIRNKSEESENYQCEERTREHKWGLRMRHYLPLITCWGQMRVLAKNNFLSIILYTALVKPKPKYVGMLTQQGMTIRTARLPGAGNLLGRAGEDLSGLPDWASRYHFFSFLLTVSYFNSSTRFRVTVTVFVLWFHNRNISFPLHHQTDRLQCRSMWLACQCS